MRPFKALTLIKRFGRRVAAEIYAHSPGFLRSLKGKVVILTYHRVVSQRELEKECIQPGMYVTVETFAEQMRFITQHFSILSFMELLDIWATRRFDLQKRYCVVTFDDGWLDNYIYAFPLLQLHRVPATIFLPTAYIGTNEWFWPERIGWLYQLFKQRSEEEQKRIWSVLEADYAWCKGVGEALRRGDSEAVVEECKEQEYEQIDALTKRWAAALEVTLPTDRQMMNWDEVREMSEAGITFGSHSVTHSILTMLSHEEVAREVGASWATLKQKSIRAIPVFCYPNGNWSDQISQCVKAAGYVAATTTRLGCESHNPEQLFSLKRVNVHQDITCTDALFGFYLAGADRI